MWRRYLAELVGTFVIVFAPVALSASLRGVAGSPGEQLASAAWVSGLAVLAMVYTLGHISAAHFNPAVTLGFAVARRFPWRFVAPYWASQFAGAILASAMVAMLLGPGSGAHIPRVHPANAVAVEALLTFMLMFVIISVATDRRANSAIPGLAIGLMVTVDVFIGGPLTGGSMNPARSLGPALFAAPAALADYWIYAVGPAVGATVAAVLYEAIRGGDEYAKGAPDNLDLVLVETTVKGAAEPIAVAMK